MFIRLTPKHNNCVVRNARKDGKVTDVNMSCVKQTYPSAGVGTVILFTDDSQISVEESMDEVRHLVNQQL